MKELSKQSCEACRVGAPILSEQELKEALAQLPGWDFNEDFPSLTKTYRFADFSEAFAFAARVALLSEKYDHHPRVTLEWGCVKVEWWTHKISGVHNNDAVLAAKTDLLFSS